MKAPALLCLLLLCACASSLEYGDLPQGKRTYSLSDIGGTFAQRRAYQLAGTTIGSRSQLLGRAGSGKVLEKSITVSQVGSVKGRKARVKTVRPFASEFTVWLEGKMYQSKMQLSEKTRSMTVSMDSPEPKWTGTRDFPFPKGKYFCFFGQIPECLYHTYLLQRARDNPRQAIGFHVLWDSYPYNQEQFTGVGNNLFAAASVKFDSENKNLFRYIVEVDGQSILYYFSRRGELVKMAWVAQGISLVPPEEASANDEEE